MRRNKIMRYFRVTLVAILAFILIGSLILINGCAKKEPETVKIGAILPLTGNLAFLGEPERNSLLLAQEGIKKENKLVNLIIEDSKGNATDGISAMNKLVAQGVKAVIVSTTGINRAVLPIAKQNKIIIFTQCMDPTITGESEYAFRIFPNYVTEQQLTASYMKEKGYKNIALYSANSAGIKPEADAFKDYAHKNGLKIILEDTFEIGQKDFRSVLFKIKKLSPDALLILAYGDSYPPIFKQIRELNIKIPILGNVAMEQAGATKFGTDIYEGTTFPSFSVAQGNEQIKNFRDRYYRKFGTYPGGFLDYPYFYDALNIISEALLSSHNNVENAREILKSNTFKGLSGEIKFSVDGDFSPPVAMAIYRSGKVEPLISKNK